VNPIFCRSLLTALIFLLLVSLLYPGTCQYSACCGMRWWSIRKTCPSQRSRFSPSMLSMVCCLFLDLTSTLVILSFHEIPSYTSAMCSTRLFVNVAVNGRTSAPYRRVDRMIASYSPVFTFRLILSFLQIILILPNSAAAFLIRTLTSFSQLPLHDMTGRTL